MLRLIGLAVSIGLADSLNPSTVGPALYLAAEQRPGRRVLEFTLSVFLVFLLGGVLITLGPGEVLLDIVPHPGHTARYIAETAVGVAMLAAAPLLWLNRDRLSRRRRREEEMPRRRSPVLVGAALSIVELPTAFPYFAVIAAIISSGLGIPKKLMLLFVYNVCFVLPLLVIVITLSIAGDHGREVLERARRYLQAHWPAIVALLALLAGIFVTTLGVSGLLSGLHDQVGRVSRHLRHVIPH